MFGIELTTRDVVETRRLVTMIAAAIGSVENEAFLRDAPTYAHELPRALRSELNFFRLEEPDCACLIRGYAVDDERIGPTPDHWRDCKGRPSTLEEEVFFLLCACLLGDPIAWATQQDAYVMHDVLPIQGHEKEQLGSGSEEVLTWHTEDAFHPLRTDYIGLMCLRNPDRVETTYASVADLELEPNLADALFERQFPIRPDRSHLPAHGSYPRDVPSEAKELLERSYEWITSVDEHPQPIAVLFGNREHPYLRLDPFFMSEPPNQRARDALRALVAQIDSNLHGYALQPGEVILLDNHRAVHGRNAFKARFDGTDRWLKRLNITRDLRRSRRARISAASRVIY